MSIVDEIKDRLDIVDVVSGYMALTKAGSNFKANCPFHQEKTPSFIVSVERQTWRCFGACSTGGDAFSFVMKKEDLGFGEALRMLAEKTGVALQSKEDGNKTDSLLRVNKEAIAFYVNILDSEEGKFAQNYLTLRGIDRATALMFQLGFSPKGGTRLKDHLTGLGFNIEHCVESGLLRRFDDGSIRDFFWGRLMFPIHDSRGNVLGFGARALENIEPKYINTPATRIFDKKNNLYGLNLAAEAVRSDGRAIIVEGYMDVIAAHQYGYRTVVASMGTALTEQQVSRLFSMAGKYVLALDPDVAGQEATLRSLESSWKAIDTGPASRNRSSGVVQQKGKSVDLRIASLPDGKDPDELIRENPVMWDQSIDTAVPFMDFYINSMISKFDTDTNEGKHSAVLAVSPLILSTTNSFDQDRYFNLLAEKLKVDRQLLEINVSKSISNQRRITNRQTKNVEKPVFLTDRRDYLEDYALALLINHPELDPDQNRLAVEYFKKTENRELFTSVRSSSTIDEVKENLDESLHEYLDALIGLRLSPLEDWQVENAFIEITERLEQRYLKELQATLLLTEDVKSPPSRDVEHPIVSLNSDLKDSFKRKQ